MTSNRLRLKAAMTSGVARVAAATALAGATGYLITWLVPREIGVEAYPTFATVWAITFLSASALSGVQQEVARATRPRITGPPDRRPWFLASVLAVVVVVVMVATAPMWASALFAESPWSLVLPLVVGGVSYLFVAVATGIFYGLGRWREIFWIVVCESGLRLLLVGLALLFAPEDAVLAWAVVLPFGLTAVVFLAVRRRTLFECGRIDTDLGGLSRNVGRTMLSAASTGVLVSGFPAVLALTSRAEPAALVGLIVLTSTLVRAPLIVTAIALQSYLIVHFRRLGATQWRSLGTIIAGIVAVGAVLAGAAWLIGPAVFAALFPDEQAPARTFFAALVLSSIAVACLCVTGSAVLARGSHSALAVGWLVAAVGTVALLLLPIDLVARTLIALIAPPILGLLTHVALLLAKSASPRTGRESSSVASTR